MAYDSRTYRILIASPSDVEEERDVAVNVIQEWNDLNSYSRKVTLLPLRWENLYVELSLSVPNSSMQISAQHPCSHVAFAAAMLKDWRQKDPSVAVESRLAKYDPDTLQQTEEGWRLSVEWDALQPQRTRIIKPILYVSTKNASALQIRARVFADTFPEPLLLMANLNLTVRSQTVELSEFMPEWKKVCEGKQDFVGYDFADLSKSAQPTWIAAKSRD